MRVETYGSLFAAVDFELTGGSIGVDAPVQFGCAIFDAHLEHTGQTFNELIRPTRPVSKRAAEIHGLTAATLMAASPDDLVAERFGEWCDSLGAPFGKRLIPIAHNWPVEAVTLYRWLGQGRTHDLFGYVARDTMAIAAALRDVGAPFKSVKLSYLCKYFDIPYNPHDALSDALATGKLYAELARKLTQCPSS